MSYYAAETTAYEWIHGTGIGPAFLGHITEAGRVIGFLMEYIETMRKQRGPKILLLASAAARSCTLWGYCTAISTSITSLCGAGRLSLSTLRRRRERRMRGSWRGSIVGWKRRWGTLLRGAGWGFPWLASNILADAAATGSEGQ